MERFVYSCRVRIERLTDEDIMGIREAAQYLRVSEHTIRRAIHEGLLPVARLRGHYRIRKADLDALFKKQPPPDEPHKGEQKGS